MKHIYSISGRHWGACVTKIVPTLRNIKGVPDA